MSITIKTIIGAEHAYACIRCEADTPRGREVHTLDVRLSPGRSVEQSLRETEAEIHAQIAKLSKRASLIRAAYTEGKLP